MPARDAAGSCPENPNLSVRMSCDRCRAHKLKCSGPVRANICQRCDRAKSVCVFGRRASSRKKLNEDGAIDQSLQRSRSRAQTSPCSPNQPTTASTPVNLATPPSTTASGTTGAATSTYLSRSSGLGPTSQVGRPIDSVTHALPGILEIDLGHFEDLIGWDDLSPVSHHSVGADMLECNSDNVGYDWLQPGWSLDKSPMTGLTHSEVTWSHSQFAKPATDENSSSLAASSAAGSSIQGSMQIHTHSSGMQDSDAMLPGQQLTYLVSEIQLQLKKLQEGPWHNDSTCALHDYPIGTILGLAERFSAIAGPILRHTPRVISGGLEDGMVLGDNETNCNMITSPNNIAEDTPTILLVMCGYMWLVRIWTVVLGHFRNYLERKTHDRERRHFGGTAAAGSGECSSSSTCNGITGHVSTFDNVGGGGGGSLGPTTTCASSSSLRLGELPCENAAVVGLQQMYSAVRMLLEAMHDIEGHLGRDATAARAMAVALLLKPGKCRHADGFADLDRQAAAVKDLLKENMGLS